MEYKIMSLYKNKLNIDSKKFNNIYSFNKSLSMQYSSGVPYLVNNNTAIIYIDKELVNSVHADWVTKYVSLVPAISEIIDMFEKDENINNYIFMIDSGGGETSGISNLSKKIKQIKKPTVCYTTDICTSAAYWLASACDKIIAGSETALFGSIGVLVYREINNNEYIVSNRQSPNKYPDLRTDEGKDAMRNLLDDIYDIFSNDVSKNRNINIEIVKEQFGKGSVFVASKALSCGMIDEIDLNFSIFNQANYDMKNMAAVIKNGTQAIIDKIKL